MINDPCRYCAVPYGHKLFCPEIISAKKGQQQAITDWERGRQEASDNVKASPEDKANGTYNLGRYNYELAVRGLLPRQRERMLRVPTKSEPPIISS